MYTQTETSTLEMYTQTETSTLEPLQPLPLDGRKCEGHNANDIFNILMLTDFIHATNTHSANCGCPMNILTFDNKIGAAIIEIWQCPRCRKCLELQVQRW